MGDFLHQAVELRGGGLVDAGFVCQSADAHRFKDAQGAEGIHVGGVFRCLEAHCHMALGAKVMNLIRLNLLNHPDQVVAVGEIATAPLHSWFVFLEGMHN